MQWNSEPNVSSSHTDKNKLVSHVKKLVLENPNITDCEMRHELSNFLKNDRSTGYSNTDEYYKRRAELFRPYTLTPFFDRNSFFNTHEMFRNINNTWDRINNAFSDLEKNFPEDETDTNENNSYVKYMSSMTSYDNNGQRKSKSISGVEKFKDGKRTVHKKMTTQDKNGTTIEEIYPDGTKKVTTKTNDNRLTDK